MPIVKGSTLILYIIIVNKIMKKIRRNHTESMVLQHHSPNKNIKRTNSSILNHELLRLQVLQKQQQYSKVFRLSQTQLCDFFMNYRPLIYSKINLKKVINKRMEQIRLIKSTNKIYFGEVKGKVRHGEGILIEDKGKIYEGNFEVNQRNGHGVQIYANGNVYLGTFLNNKKHGRGQFYWFSLSPPVKQNAKYVQYYEGTWWGGLPDGSGSHQKSNGDVYDGTFKNGLKHGQGQEYFFNGDSYKGEYINGLPEGYGIYHWSDGSRYQGDFKQGMRSGHGCWISGNDNQSYKGPYVLDKKSGYGQYRWSDRFTYKGNFENDLRNGFGELYEDDDLKYRGEWVNGQIVSEVDNSTFISPKSEKLPTLKKLKPPSSAIIKRLRTISPQSQKSQLSPKSLSRSRSPKSSKGLKKLNRVFSESKKTTSLKKTVKKRPLQLPKSQHHHQYQVLIKKCNKKNCGCNLSIPVKSPSGSKYEKRSFSQKHYH